MVINVRLVYKMLYKRALFSILHFKCKFIHSTILDCLLAFQVINEKENFDNQQVAFLKQICHYVHAQIYGTFCIYKKVTACTFLSTLGSK